MTVKPKLYILPNPASQFFKTPNLDMDSLEKPSSPGHNFLHLSFILSSVFTFILTTVFNGLAGSGAGVPTIFYSTVGNLSDKYQLFITPAGFTFSIWSVIYLWLAISLVCLTVSLWTRVPGGGLVYLTPPVATPSVTATLSVNFICNLVWIFLWDREQTVAASVFLFLIAITNITTLAFFLKNIEDNSHKFERASPTFYWGIIYRVTANGLGIYTAWTVIASLINLTTAMHYSGSVAMLTSCLVSLSLLHMIALTWFLLSSLVFHRYTRYLYTPFLVVVWAAFGIWSKKSGDEAVPQEIKDFVLATIIVGALLFVLSVAEKVYRTVKGKYARIDVLQ